MTGMRGVIGQRAMLERLGARASRGDVAHAYGIFGPASIGKRTIALRLAQTLNCLDPKRPAGGCGTCNRASCCENHDVRFLAIGIAKSLLTRNDDRHNEEQHPVFA